MSAASILPSWVTSHRHRSSHLGCALIFNSIKTRTSRRWPADQINDNITTANKVSKTNSPPWALSVFHRDSLAPSGSQMRNKVSPATRISRKAGRRRWADQEEVRDTSEGMEAGSRTL